MKFPLSWLLFNKWFWITISCMAAVMIGPLFVVALILALPGVFKGIAILLLIFGWGIASGYKDWVIARRQEQKKMKPRIPEDQNE